MSRIFLSHSSRDSLRARALKQWLIEQDPSLADDIFLDVDVDTGISTGVKWKDALRDANTRCEAVIVLLSPEWESSGECIAEYRVAEYLHKPIFCARLEPLTSREKTGEWQQVDLFGTGKSITVTVGGDHVRFLEDGVLRLRKGLSDAGIGAEHYDRRFLVLDIVRPERAAVTGDHGLAAAIHATRMELELTDMTRQAVESVCLSDVDNLPRIASFWQRKQHCGIWLLEDPRLSEAERLATKARLGDRFPAVPKLLEASRRREHRRRKSARRRMLIGRTVVAVIVLVAATAVVGFVQASNARDNADARTREAIARRLLDRAPRMIEGDLPGGDLRGLQEMLTAYTLHPESTESGMLAAVVGTPHLRKITSIPALRNRRATFSVDGQRVAGGVGTAIEVWNVDTGELGHSMPVFNISFSPKGDVFASAGMDHAVIVWPVPGKWRDILCAKLSANMSRKQWKEWISSESDYVSACPGLPIAADEP
ncbi:toll/interleukin-1 receptor domain-containing protein [Nocardia sp. GCM10030253]|uniref:toll/interleukin-1 receptor domain-containing protein n=1 Tax=Nocardia sp. GCM10030253 TaxID=3273404 RepID=UPI0036312EDC